MSLQPGQPVDRFIVERELGEGGMATVYLVEHNLLGSRHALKVLDSELLVNPRIRERFLAEGRIQAQLQHPNIVRVTDIVAADGLAALVMEYVEGPTLAEHIEAHGALPAAEILALFLPVLDAIGAAHARGILHRDLKPSNILIGSAGGAPRPVVLDFGIARVTDEADEALQLRQQTRDGAQIGTPAWMSPEQVRGRTDLDERSDVFSLGAILYEMATGRTAFEADSEFDTMNNVVTGRWDAPTEAVPGDHRGTIAACITKALAVEREDRFQSIEAFRAALIEATAPVLDPTPTDELDSITSVGEPVTVATVADEPAPAPAPVVVEARTPRVFTAIVGGIMALVLLVVVGVNWNNARQAKAAKMAATVSKESALRAMRMLAKRQTDPVSNADPAVLGAALQVATKAVTSARTPEALSIHALMKVLHDGWHLSARTWDEDAFANVESQTRGALVAGSSIESELARAIVAARACRLLADSDARRQGFCDEGEQRFEQLRAWLRRDTRAWLRVEHGWMSVGFLNVLAQRADTNGETARRVALGTRSLATCDALIDLPDGRAVNQGILPGACLAAAGHADDFGAYYRYARWLRARDQAPDGKLLSSNVRAIYENVGPAACRGMPFDKKNEYNRTLPSGSRPEHMLCTVVGLYALDCPFAAAKMSLYGSVLHASAGLPFARAATSFERDAKHSCYLTADVGD